MYALSHTILKRDCVSSIKLSKLLRLYSVKSHGPILIVVDTTILGIIINLMPKFQGPVLNADKVVAATGSHRKALIAHKDMLKPKFLRTNLQHVSYSDTP